MLRERRLEIDRLVILAQEEEAQKLEALEKLKKEKMYSESKEIANKRLEQQIQQMAGQQPFIPALEITTPVQQVIPQQPSTPVVQGSVVLPQGSTNNTTETKKKELAVVDEEF